MDQVPSTQYNVTETKEQKPAPSTTKKGLCDDEAECCLFG